ncbi:hypothetical protein HO173_010007 [Letharia columbiana]|uniref:NB-ARC domain-containing protein n=1 Tax=Letharia columbiana TaxID=112416 RepID=A0A8H6L157_9LECA|nr:uncharacterized protein HO173_010007 [Letharia columbiana]KAF6231705.1 hypothetical protein HO173_010007 [Letharia columbiana]
MPLRQLYSAEDVDKESQVDIIAVHGLNPRSKDDEEHAWDTWRTPAGDDGRIWLKDDLPKRYTSQARIFLWVYNSTLVYGKDRGQFIDKANDLLEALRIERRQDPDRPLIFLAHSLGGILVQQALVNAHNNPRYTRIRTSTTGLVFFGTPHDGGNKSLVALGSAAARVASTLHLQSSNAVIETLKSGSLFTDLLGEQWRHQLESYQLVSFWEGIGNTVPKKSATFGLSGTRENIIELNAEHSDLCRFGGSRRDQDNFKLVASNIQDLYDAALERTHVSLANDSKHLQGQEQFQLVFSLAAAPEIDYFVGRASNLASIESVLLPFTAAERKVVVLHGLGGIGKSQLAIEFAKKHRDDYSAILWLNGKTEDTLKQSFATNARRLPKEHLNQELLNESQNEEVLNAILREMKTWLGLRGNDKWLLIYDNVDNPKISDNKRQHAYDVRSYFPEAHQGSILVTTRWKTLRIGRPIEVTKLSEDEESVSLLVQTSGRSIEEDPRTKDLIRKLDGLPLALATAGGYLGLTGIPVSAYLDHYEASWLELQRTSPSLPSYEDQTIYSTWNLSYICIRKENKSAAKLLELWAYFDNRDLWYDLLKAGEDEAPDWFLDIIGTKLAFNSAIGKLRKHALIEKLTESDGYSMHHCVHAWVKTFWCTPVEGQNVKLALTCVGETFPFNPAPGDWITQQRLSLHFERCLQILPQWVNKSKDSRKSEDCISTFFCSLGRLYHDQGKLTEAESMYLRALAGYEKNSNHRYIFPTVNILGILYGDQGKLTEAGMMYQRALAGYEKAFGSRSFFYIRHG